MAYGETYRCVFPFLRTLFNKENCFVSMHASECNFYSILTDLTFVSGYAQHEFSSHII